MKLEKAVEKTTENNLDHLDEYLEDAIYPNNQSPQTDNAVYDWPWYIKKDDLFESVVSIS